MGFLLDAGTIRHDPPERLREFLLARRPQCSLPRSRPAGHHRRPRPRHRTPTRWHRRTHRSLGDERPVPVPPPGPHPAAVAALPAAQRRIPAVDRPQRTGLVPARPRPPPRPRLRPATPWRQAIACRAQAGATRSKPSVESTEGPALTTWRGSRRAGAVREREGPSSAALGGSSAKSWGDGDPGGRDEPTTPATVGRGGSRRTLHLAQHAHARRRRRPPAARVGRAANSLLRRHDRAGLSGDLRRRRPPPRPLRPRGGLPVARGAWGRPHALRVGEPAQHTPLRRLPRLPDEAVGGPRRARHLPRNLRVGRGPAAPTATPGRSGACSSS